MIKAGQQEPRVRQKRKPPLASGVHNQSNEGFATDANSTPAQSVRIAQTRPQQIKPPTQAKKPHPNHNAPGQKELKKWKPRQRRMTSKPPVNRAPKKRETTNRKQTPNNKIPPSRSSPPTTTQTKKGSNSRRPNRNKQPGAQQRPRTTSGKGVTQARAVSQAPPPPPTRRVSAIGTMLRRMSNHQIFKRRSSSAEDSNPVVKTEREKGPFSPSPTLNRHPTNEPNQTYPSRPVSPVASFAQTNNEAETPILPSMPKESLDKPVRVSTRLVRGGVRRQSSEKLLGVSHKLFEKESSDIRHMTFPGAGGDLVGDKDQSAPRVLRGYDFKPVNRSPRMPVKRKPQVWPQRPTRAAQNPSKLTSINLDSQDDSSQASPSLEMRHVDDSKANNLQVNEMPLTSSFVRDTDQTDRQTNDDMYSDRCLDVDDRPLSRVASSPRVRELKLKLGRKEAAFANRLKLLDAQLMDVKGKFGDMTTRTEPPATPPRLVLPQARTQPREDSENDESDFTTPLSPTTPTAAPVFGPVAMFSVPTLTLVRAKTFIREETQAGAEEIDYMEDAKRIVESLKAQAQEQGEQHS